MTSARTDVTLLWSCCSFYRVQARSPSYFFSRRGLGRIHILLWLIIQGRTAAICPEEGLRKPYISSQNHHVTAATYLQAEFSYGLLGRASFLAYYYGPESRVHSSGTRVVP